MIKFSNGTTIDYEPGAHVKVLGLDYDGDIVVETVDTDLSVGGLRYPLTPCCRATGKGCWDERADRGIIACRKCYREVDPKFASPSRPEDIEVLAVA